MKAIDLNLAQASYLAVAQKTYFIKRLEYSTQLLPTACPHRGAPLYMGEVTDEGRSMVCPWHANAFKICNLEKQSLPVVRVADHISTIIGDTDRCMPLLKLYRYNTRPS